MTESITDGTSTRASENAGNVHTLADVLEREFRELHEGDPQKEIRPALGQDGPAVFDGKQQQPLADPSLAPADDRARDPRMKPDEIDKTPSQRPISFPRQRGYGGFGRTYIISQAMAAPHSACQAAEYEVLLSI